MQTVPKHKNQWQTKPSELKEPKVLYTFGEDRDRFNPFLNDGVFGFLVSGFSKILSLISKNIH